MARPAKSQKEAPPETPLPGLYKQRPIDSAPWWLRVKMRGRTAAPRSTGYPDVATANKVARMLAEWYDRENMQEWLDAAWRGEPKLDAIYRAWSGPGLHTLKADRARADADRADIDLRPFVDEWIRVDVETRRNKKDAPIGAQQKEEYARQVRALIPADERFPRSKLTDVHVSNTLAALRHHHTGEALGGSTLRAYFNAWQQFYRFARSKSRANIAVDPFVDVRQPKRGTPRTIWLEFATTLALLDVIDEGEIKVALRLAFGSGFELSALRGLRGKHWRGGDDLEIVAPGTKTDNRTRPTYVPEWTRDAVAAHMTALKPNEPAFPSLLNDGDDIRDVLYRAQVQLGLVDEPRRSERSGKPMWGELDLLHTLHDCRHTFAMTRLGGLDGGPALSPAAVAQLLGHADAQMVTRVYAKDTHRRLVAIELREAKRKAKHGLALLKGAA